MNNRILYIPKEKKQFSSRKKKYNLRVAAAFVIVAVMLVLVFFGVRWRALQIEKISISGLSAIQEEDVNREISSALSGSFAAGLIPYRFLLTVPASAIAARIKEKFPLISDAEVKKEFPNVLAVTVTERQLFGVRHCEFHWNLYPSMGWRRRDDCFEHRRLQGCGRHPCPICRLPGSERRIQHRRRNFRFHCGRGQSFGGVGQLRLGWDADRHLG